MRFSVIKHDGHMRTEGKCRKHEPKASSFAVSYRDNAAKNNKTRFFYVLHAGFSANQSARRDLFIKNEALDLTGV